MFLLCYSLVQFLEMLLGVRLAYIVYPEHRHHNKFIKSIMLGLYLLWGTLYIWNGYLSYVSNVFLILNNIVLSFLNYLYLKGSYRCLFILEGLYSVTTGLFKVPLLILVGIYRRENSAEINRGDKTILELLWILFICIIIFIIVEKRSNIKKLLTTILIKYKKLLFIILCAEWGMLTYCMFLGKRGFEIGHFILSFVFSLFIVLMSFYIILTILYQEIKNENLIMDVSKNILKNQNVLLQEIDDKNRTKMHDIKHIMLYIANCIEKGNKEEALGQIYSFTAHINNMEERIWTGFPFLDYLINYKKVEMDEKGIDFCLEMDLYEIPFEEAELGVVLGNLFDNAIEAAQQCDEYKRTIFLKLSNVNQMFFLIMRNSSTKSPKLKNGRFITTKDDANLHGLGVESVKRFVEKEKGQIEFQYDEEHFEVSILI